MGTECLPSPSGTACITIKEVECPTPLLICTMFIITTFSRGSRSLGCQTRVPEAMKIL